MTTRKFSDSTLFEDISVFLSESGTTLAVDFSGSNAALGDRKGVHIIDLEEPNSPSKWLHYASQQDMLALEWNQTALQRNLLAASSSRNLLIWDANIKNALQSSIQAHANKVLDLSWSHHDANLIATCSADTFVYTWDIRDSKKPRHAFCAYTAAASIVKWNRVNPNIIASTHEGQVYIWDTRRGKEHLARVTAYTSKITGLDWSYINELEFVICADKSARIWKYTQPQKPQYSVSTNTNPALPLHKVRFTPTGDGIIGIPSRGHYSVHIWKFTDDKILRPQDPLTGHTDVIKAADWRVIMHGSHPHYQLLSWSKDQHLRWWRLETPPLDCTKADLAASATAPILVPLTTTAMKPTVADDTSLPATTSIPAPSTSMTDSRFLAQDSNVKQEILRMESLLDSVRVIYLNMTERKCTVDLGSPHHVTVDVSFPGLYPFNSPPQFVIQSHSSFSSEQFKSLESEVSALARSYADQARACLLPCIRFLIERVEKLPKRSEEDAPRPSVTLPPVSMVRKLSVEELDARIPSPPLSGARFGPHGKLIYFNNFVHVAGLSSVPNELLPRTLLDFKKSANIYEKEKLKMLKSPRLGAVTVSKTTEGNPSLSRTVSVGSGKTQADEYNVKTMDDAIVAGGKPAGPDTTDPSKQQFQSLVIDPRKVSMAGVSGGADMTEANVDDSDATDSTAPQPAVLATSYNSIPQIWGVPGSESGGTGYEENPDDPESLEMPLGTATIHIPDESDSDSQEDANLAPGIFDSDESDEENPRVRSLQLSSSDPMSSSSVAKTLAVPHGSRDVESRSDDSDLEPTQSKESQPSTPLRTVVKDPALAGAVAPPLSIQHVDNSGLEPDNHSPAVRSPVSSDAGSSSSAASLPRIEPMHIITDAPSMAPDTSSAEQASFQRIRSHSYNPAASIGISQPVLIPKPQNFYTRERARARSDKQIYDQPSQVVRNEISINEEENDEQNAEAPAEAALEESEEKAGSFSGPSSGGTDVMDSNIRRSRSSSFQQFSADTFGERSGLASRRYSGQVPRTHSTTFYPAGTEEVTRRANRPFRRLFGDTLPLDTIPTTIILLQDYSFLEPISKELATGYTLQGSDVRSICKHNYLMALAAHETDAATAWRLAYAICDRHINAIGSSLSLDGTWSSHPMGGRLAQKLVYRYLRKGDVQTAAMLASVFLMEPPQGAPVLNPSKPLVGDTMASETWNPLTTSASLLPSAVSVEPYEPHDKSGLLVDTTPCRILYSEYLLRCEAFEQRVELLKLLYHTELHRIRQSLQPAPLSPMGAELLHLSRGMPVGGTLLRTHASPSSTRASTPAAASIGTTAKTKAPEPKAVETSILWESGLLRAITLMDDEQLIAERSKQASKKVLETMTAEQKSGGTGETLGTGDDPLVGYCSYCHTATKTVQCTNKDCRHLTTCCSVCRQAVRGVSSYCFDCGHGGHSAHLRSWFAEGHIYCPTGCGCACVDFTSESDSSTAVSNAHNILRF